MPFLLSAIAISRKAGVHEFTLDFVRSAGVQDLMQRVQTEFDPAIEAKGYDKMRSRVEVTLTDGRKLVREADERYRGGPDNPLSDAELQDKFSDCTHSILSDTARKAVIGAINGMEELDDVNRLIERAATPDA